MKKVLFTAAHSGYSLDRMALGGGAAVCDHLTREWTRTRPFALEVLGPSVLGERAPRGKDLLAYSELQYARFCLDFERRLTQTILPQDPKRTVVLSNDVCEGPDFLQLSAKGYAVYTIYHVDVVDYVASIYLRSWARPEWTTALYRVLNRWKISGILPPILKLIWEKQAASVRYSRGLIVPSAGMKDVFLRCYPGLDPERVHILPWGAWKNPARPEDVALEKKSLESDFPVAPGSWTLLTLSRISPEKGQNRLLEALALWEKQPDYPKNGVSLYIAGAPAYMKGKSYEKKLKILAARLERTRVYFVGYASGARKKALFELSDLYVFPSRHESYGLTLMEALREGKPVLAAPSHGAQEVFRPDFGEMIPSGLESEVPRRLLQALRRLLADRRELHRRGALAQAWAGRQDFSETASRLAELIASP